VAPMEGAPEGQQNAVYSSYPYDRHVLISAELGHCREPITRVSWPVTGAYSSGFAHSGALCRGRGLGACMLLT